MVGDGTRNLGLFGVGLVMVGFYFGIWDRSLVGGIPPGHKIGPDV